MKKIIEVVPYNPDWPHIYEKEAELIANTLGDNFLEIHHIGSTAVPNLAAKPIIDMIAVVRNITKVDDYNDAMKALGYQAMGECGMPLRRFFQKGSHTKTHNIHIFEQNNSEIERHIQFRDWMRTHSKDRQAYAELKKNLSASCQDDIFSYSSGKEAFIAAIDKKSGWFGFRFVKALMPREWQAVKHFRNTYFFEPYGIDDPYTWTFDHQEHAHLVLYQGVDITGYAHIQFWPDHRAAMRIIAIDENKRHQNVGSEFLALLEKWLKEQGTKSIHAESRRLSLRFYLKNGYVEMPFHDPQSHGSDSNDVPVGKIFDF